MAINLQRLFDRYGWAVDEPESGIWRARFSTESDEEFDLYAMVDDAWVRLAITPLLPRPADAQRPRLNASLLEANAMLTGARLAVDSEGDVALHGDLPAANLTYAQFGAMLDEMVRVATAAAELAALA